MLFEKIEKLISFGKLAFMHKSFLGGSVGFCCLLNLTQPP